MLSPKARAVYPPSAASSTRNTNSLIELLHVPTIPDATAHMFIVDDTPSKKQLSVPSAETL
jgi:hypothetical protein